MAYEKTAHGRRAVSNNGDDGIFDGPSAVLSHIFVFSKNPPTVRVHAPPSPDTGPAAPYPAISSTETDRAEKIKVRTSLLGTLEMIDRILWLNARPLGALTVGSATERDSLLTGSTIRDEDIIALSDSKVPVTL